MKNNKLKVLSVHTSNQCSVNCPFCYLDKSELEQEKPHEWWMEFFDQIEHVEQVALAWNEQPVENICQYLERLQKKNIIANITCNPKMITEEVAGQLKEAGVRMISLSVDRFKCKTLNVIDEPVQFLKEKNIFAGINLLLDDDIVQHIDLLVRKLLYLNVDMIYALQPKPDTLTIDFETLKKNLMLCSLLYAPKFSIDQSLKLKFGQISSCERGTHLLSINNLGELCLCSFDKPFVNFSGKIYPIETTTKTCPFL